MIRDDQNLSRLQKFKQVDHALPEKIGQDMLAFFKHSVQKRQSRIGAISRCWAALVPDTLNRHCALESFANGSLTVIVDSSPHLYELKQLLLCGLQKQILLACRSTGLKKINLKPGRWYEGDSAETGKIKF